MNTAKLIVLEGGDAAGKATQTALLVAYLQKEGYKVGTMDFPRYTQNTFGKLIKESLLGLHGDFMQKDPRIASVLYAADRFEAKAEILALCECNEIVVFDRYVTSNMLHQGAKIEDETERHEFLLWLEHVEYDIFGLPKPDLTLALFVSPTQSRALLQQMVIDGKKNPDIAEQDTVHQERVASCLLWLSTVKDSWSTIQCSNEEMLRTREDIHNEILTHVKLLLS